MWQFYLRPEVDYLLPNPPGTNATTLGGFGTYDLLIVDALVH